MRVMFLSALQVPRRGSKLSAMLGLALALAVAISNIGVAPVVATAYVANQTRVAVANVPDAPEATCPAGGQCFADVPPSNPFYEFANRIYQQDLVSGYACGGAGEPCDSENRPYFRPGSIVTRQQMAKFIDQARRQPGIYIDATSNLIPIEAYSSNTIAIRGISTSILGSAGVWGESGGNGVYGKGSTGVFGESVGGSGMHGTSTSGSGVSGISGSGVGISGESSSSHGVFGISQSQYGVGGRSNTGVGVYGFSESNAGVEGESTNSDGVSGGATAQGAAGVYGSNANGNGVRGFGATGVHGSGATGVFAEGTSYGVYATSSNGAAVVGISTDGRGVRGQTSTSDGVAGFSLSGDGVSGTSTSGDGVYGESTSGWAGFFQGNVNVTGSCCGASKGTYRIDHPLDPANKYLYHSAVESADMKNIYDGVVTLDAKGEAWVTMPDWIEALNRDFRYQLTAIGASAPDLYVAEELKGNRFKIAGGKAGMKVSWMVTGIRQDPYAQEYGTPVEVEKPESEQGLYLHPELYGQPDSKSIANGKQP